MISAGVEGRLPYMTYSEPWRGPPKQPPELFLRPAPKPATSRYNGVNTTTYPNGTRIAPPARPIGKYPSPPSVANPVNHAQTKDEVSDDMSPYSPYRLFTHASQFPPFAYPLCQPAFLMRPNFPPTPLSPMDTFSPTTPTSTFLSPPSTFSPPSAIKNSQTVLREKRTPPQQPLQSSTSSLPHPASPSIQTQSREFKVPCGKEGSLKHRLLRTDDVKPLDLQKPVESRKRLQATISPPRSPKKALNNNLSPGSFAKGSLIQLHTGELRKIEDMRTEDFIMSAERSPELRLAESTVVKIEESQHTGSATITLTYNQRRAQVKVESSMEHPYFVMGHGWASCNPERTEHYYGLKVHKLQVGDILISLTPREPAASPVTSRNASTIITTATTTSMTARQLSVSSISNQTQPINLHLSSAQHNQQQHASQQPMSPEDSLAARKRRWSAPDQICDEEEQTNAKRHRVE